MTLLPSQHRIYHPYQRYSIAHTSATSANLRPNTYPNTSRGDIVHRGVSSRSNAAPGLLIQ